MATKQQAMDALKALIATVSATGQPALTGVYRWPDDFTKNVKVPFAMVAEQKFIQHTMGAKSSGLGIDRYAFDVLYFFSEGEHIAPSAEGAIAEAKDKGWRRATHIVLADNLTLSDTVLQIGAEGAGNSRDLAYYTKGFFQWNEVIYWGMLCQIPVTQLEEMDISE